MVKVKVSIYSLTLGGREWHKEERIYKHGDILDVPEEAIAKLGTSIERCPVVAEPPKPPVKPIVPEVSTVEAPGSETPGAGESEEKPKPQASAYKNKGKK